MEGMGVRDGMGSEREGGGVEETDGRRRRIGGMQRKGTIRCLQSALQSRPSLLHSMQLQYSSPTH